MEGILRSEWGGKVTRMAENREKVNSLPSSLLIPYEISRVPLCCPSSSLEDVAGEDPSQRSHPNSLEGRGAQFRGFCAGLR